MIAKLADRWNLWAIEAENATNKETGDLMRACAKELRDALPVWTKITEDESTWPDGLAFFVFTNGDAPEILDFSVDDDWDIPNGDTFNIIGSSWRPLCDLDSPGDSE